MQDVANRAMFQELQDLLNRDYLLNETNIVHKFVNAVVREYWDWEAKSFSIALEEAESFTIALECQHDEEILSELDSLQEKMFDTEVRYLQSDIISLIIDKIKSLLWVVDSRLLGKIFDAAIDEIQYADSGHRHPVPHKRRPESTIQTTTKGPINKSHYKQRQQKGTMKAPTTGATAIEAEQNDAFI